LHISVDDLKHIENGDSKIEFCCQLPFRKSIWKDSHMFDKREVSFVGAISFHQKAGSFVVKCMGNAIYIEIHGVPRRSLGPVLQRGPGRRDPQKCKSMTP
jgi:hypothetical protein